MLFIAAPAAGQYAVHGEVMYGDDLHYIPDGKFTVPEDGYVKQYTLTLAWQERDALVYFYLECKRPDH